MRFPTIPPDEQMGLTRLATLTDDQVVQLRSVLSAAPVLLSREGFLKGIPSVEGVVREDQEKIISALAYLNGYLATGTYDVSEFISDVRESLSDRGVTAEITEKLATLLPGLLGIDTLRLRAKAVDLGVDHHRAFQNARVLTDIRPVFAADNTADIKGALVYHTLKIEYFQDTDTREIFIALDERDLATLQQALARAEDKARTLRELLLSKLDIKDFSAERD